MIPEFLLDEDCEIVLDGVTWRGKNDLILNLRVLEDGSRWVATCVDTQDWLLRDRFSEGLGLRLDDPLLWRWTFAIYTTYFFGKASDPYRAAADVLNAVPSGSGALQMGRFELGQLLETGSGSFGPLPVPAIKRIQAALTSHNIEVYPLGNDESEVSEEYHSLWFGLSYVVAQRFLVERQS